MMPSCAFCMWSMNETTDDGKWCCMAYPDGIPDDIIDGKRVHDKVQPDQQSDYVLTFLGVDDG